METIVEGPPDDGGHDLPLVNSAEWTTQHCQEIVNSNSTLLYIAVEYVKDYKMETRPDSFGEFDPHVSPLDPNMSSVARYSPVYNEPSTEFNPVVIHQLVTQDSSPVNNQILNNYNTNSTLEVIPTRVLCNNDLKEVSSRYLQMVDENNTSLAGNCNGTGLQLVPENEQEVELLITDQATGISYSVSTQELLVERCLQDEQLLEALAPNPLLESDLLTLDDNTLKSELNDDIIQTADISAVEAQVNNYINHLTCSNLQSVNNANTYKMETRASKSTEDDPEEQLLSCVYSITDKPILSRARATLPESYLVINKINDVEGVFAKKVIPKRTQFGPLEGSLSINVKDPSDEPNTVIFYLDGENGIITMDTSNQNNSNWMCFVRKAHTYEEQNLVLSQENNALYFTTTQTILPKQELKVGYSTSYAHKYKLRVLHPIIKKTWPCFECSSEFSCSDELQDHLNIHDKEKEENIKPRRKLIKYKRRTFKKCETEALECNLCFNIYPQYTYTLLKKHLNEAHSITANFSVEENYSIVINYKCEICEVGFKSEALLKIHNIEHDPDSIEEQMNHVCPSCLRKFPTQRQLVQHVLYHALPKKIMQSERIKCPVCYKMFAMRERLQKHMLVHGSEESKPLQCKTCNKRFLNNSALACHLKTHYTGLKMFECPICKENFDHVLKLKLHVPEHCENNQYTCPHCNKLFKKYSIIRKHIRAFHCERKHSCSHCDKSFPTLDKLRMHMLRHSDHREFLCADCGKQFKRKDKLKEHCKRMHSEERENNIPVLPKPNSPQAKKFTPKVEPTDFHRFIYKCHACLVGFKRRGMLVNHLAKRHPDIRPDSVPELNLPILQTTRDYYCQYCEKVYKSSSKRKLHILKNHPGAALPMSNRKQGSLQEVSGLPNPTFSQTVGSITTSPQNCKWCHKQYASKAKLLQHQRKKHVDQMESENHQNKSEHESSKSMKVEDVYAGNHAVSEDFNKVTEVNTISSTIEDFNIEDDTQYCQLVLNEGDGTYIETGNLENPNSHLYRLLSTSNGMLPPR